MRITSITFEKDYITDCPQELRPFICKVRIQSEDPDYSWQYVEQTLTPDQARVVAATAAEFVVADVKGCIADLRFSPPTADEIELWKRANEPEAAIAADIDALEFTPEEVPSAPVNNRACGDTE